MREPLTLRGLGKSEKELPSGKGRRSELAGDGESKVTKNTKDRIEDIARDIIDAAMVVHTEMGPGLLESVYSGCMVMELEERGHVVGAEVPIKVLYKGRPLRGDGFRMDLLVDDLVVVELKSVITVTDVHKKQLLSYLRLSDKHLGLLLNFNELRMKHGITRIINGFL
jgi:GxxExxY protein